MKAQEQTFRTQQGALDNIQRMLAQLLTNQNNETTSGNHNREEKNLSKDTSEGEHSNETSSIDAEVIKGIEAQIASLTQRDELKKVAMTNSVSYPLKFKPPTLHSYDSKSWPNQHIYYFWFQTDNVIDNDAIMTRLFIGTLKAVAFDWFRAFLTVPSTRGLT